MASSSSSLTVPEVTFQPYVKEFLKRSFCNEKALGEVGEDVCTERWKNLLTALSYPPLHTVLRVNTLHHSKEDTKEKLRQALLQQYRLRERLPPDVSDHTSLDDTLVISPCGLPGATRTCTMSVSPSSKQVVVDLHCGLAVLRGADIFAPGVMAAPLDMVQGDKVSVYVDVNGACRRGLTKPFEGEKVLLGNGQAVVGRRELFVGSSQSRGVAVTMTEPIFDCPSLNGILTDRLFLQNLPSIVVGHVLKPAPGSKVLDMCAAPGGKTTHLGSLMKDQGILVALDKSQSKINKVRQNAKRLGLSCVQAYVYDSTKACCTDMEETSSQNSEIHAPPYPPKTFDFILLDAPCSGLGQRPQICNQLQLSEIKSYPAYQRQFLATAVSLLRPGGTLVYSTCTVTLAENEGMVEWVLNSYPQLTLSEQIPHLGGVGIEGTNLNASQLSRLQRFHPISSFTSDSPPHCDQDTIGFFIAKFLKCMEGELT